MADIVLLFTLQGQIVGERVGVAGVDPLVLKNPCLVIPNETGVSFVPLTQLSEDKALVFNENQLLFKTISTPILPVLNKFNELFGSGIKIVQSF